MPAYLIVGPWEDEDKYLKTRFLRKNVPDIDLIISGHTHTQLDEPIQTWRILILYPVGNTEEILERISMTQKE